MNEIICFSGGLDSYVAWLKLGKPQTIHFVNHSRYSIWEFAAVERLQKLHLEMNAILLGVSFMRNSEQEDAWIPGRNDMFIRIAAYYGDHIYLPCQLGERNIEDRSEEFFRNISEDLTKHHRRQKIADPVFVNETKADLIKFYLDQGYPIDNLKLTYSCFLGFERRCGSCPACFRTALALIYNEISYRDWFLDDPMRWEGVDEYIEKFRSGHYDSRRNEQSLDALRKVGRI